MIKVKKILRFFELIVEKIKKNNFLFGDEFKVDFDLRNRDFFCEYCEKHGLQPIENFYEKKSDTVFILGSGESLADLTDEAWNHISQHDSIGVNMSIIHDYPVNYQFWEVRENLEANELFLKAINYKHSSGDDVKVVISSSFVFFNDSLEIDFIKSNIDKLNYYLDSVYLSMNYPRIDKFISLYKYLRLKSKKNVHHRTHIAAVLDFAYLQGYKKAVLIGCDLNGGKYFHQVESKSKIYNKNKFYDAFELCIIDEQRKIYEQHSTGGLHISMAKNIKGNEKSLTAVDYFKAISICYEDDMKIYVSSGKSILSDFFNIYEFNK